MTFKPEAANVYIYPVHTSHSRKALRRRIPELLSKFPTNVLIKARTNSITSFDSHDKFQLIDSIVLIVWYRNAHICSRST